MEQWTTDGCNTSVGQGGIITCRCNHLTNFAILVVCTITMHGLLITTVTVTYKETVISLQPLCMFYMIVGCVHGAKKLRYDL